MSKLDRNSDQPPAAGLFANACRTYAHWLGLSNSALPNHYELLGLPHGACDHQQITAAARQRLLLIQNLPREVAIPALQQSLLEQITLAQKCLLDPVRKAIYDAQLHAGRSTPAPTRQPSAGSTSAASDLLSPPAVAQHGARPPLPARGSLAGHLVPWSVHSMRIAGVVVLGLLLLVVAWLARSSTASQPSQLPDTMEVAQREPSSPPTPATLPAEAPAPSPQPETKTSPPPVPPAKTPAEEEPADASPLGEDEPEDEPQRPHEDPNPAPYAVLANPFLRWPAEITLPYRPQPAQGAIGHGSSAIPLGPMPSNVPLELHLNDVTADVGQLGGFQLIRDEDSATGAWRIVFVSREPTNAGRSLLSPTPSSGSETVAHLELSAGQLMFRWNEACEAPQAEQLRNCALELNVGVHQHALRLRRVELRSVHILDLSEPTSWIVTNSAPLPPLDTLFLEVKPGLDFASEWTLKPSNGRVGLNEELRLIHTTAPEAEIVVRMVKSDDTLRVQISSYYILGDRRQPLGDEKMRQTLANLQRTLIANNNRFDSARRTAEELRRDISFVQSQPVPVGPDHMVRGEMMRRYAQVVDLRTRVRSMESRMARMADAIPKTRATILEVEQVALLGEQLHQKAELSFRIGAETFQGDVLLLLAGDRP